MKTIKYDHLIVGCYIDESAGSADDCNRRTIQFAQAYGFKPGRGWNHSRSEGLSWRADEAVQFLNELEDRPYMFWEFEDNSLFLTVNVDGAREDIGFVSSNTVDYPPDDYEGEWMRVSDHGNATLYVREAGKDREIWAVV